MLLQTASLGNTQKPADGVRDGVNSELLGDAERVRRLGALFWARESLVLPIPSTLKLRFPTIPQRSGVFSILKRFQIKDTGQPSPGRREEVQTDKYVAVTPLQFLTQQRVIHHNIVYYVTFYNTNKNTEMQYMNTAKCEMVMFFLRPYSHF